ncbi:MAG: hypothetical protein RLZZ455_180 [Candidatus Parcubacteria bacterium]|jgi:glycosyltransferase involved in cell wall biosynthesis
MKILFFTYDFPYPTNSGGKTRAFNLLKFAKKDAEIILFSFVRNMPSTTDLNALRDLGIEDIRLFPRRKLYSPANLVSFFSKNSIFYSLYFTPTVHSELLDVVREKKIDLVHFESFYTGFYLHHALTQLGVKQVFGTENIEHLLYKEFADSQKFLPARLFFQSQVKKIKQEEEAFYHRSDCILTVTETERDQVSSVCGKRVEIVPNGVDIASFENAERKSNPEKTLLFMGNFTYFPNRDAMQWFIAHVFPQLPDDIRLIVVGRNSSKQEYLRDRRIETVEFVENIHDVYSKGSVMIAPVRIGGGTNFKILEAMASKMPVVALSERIDGLGFSGGKELLIAKNASEFAEMTVRLLEDKKLQRDFAATAFSAVEKKYSWTGIGAKLYNTWSSLVHEKS